MKNYDNDYDRKKRAKKARRRRRLAKLAIGLLLVLLFTTAGIGLYLYESNLVRDVVEIEAGTEPDVKSFLKKDDPKAYFCEGADDIDIRIPGDYNVKVKTGLFKHKAVLRIVDTTPPVLEASDEIRLKLGENISYRSYFETADNSSEEIQIDIDSSEVDLSKEGTYTAYVTSADLSGNASRTSISVTIYDSVYSEDDLWAIVDPILEKIFTPDMGPREKVAAIQNYVTTHCKYHVTPDTKDWIKAAVEGFNTGKGDCFTDTCMGKALFTRAGFKNMIIYRIKGNEDDHAWNLVDIDDGHGWYHVDCVNREDGHPEWVIVLFTDEQLKWVDSFIGDYHDYDRNQYPDIK